MNVGDRISGELSRRTGTVVGLDHINTHAVLVRFDGDELDVWVPKILVRVIK